MRIEKYGNRNWAVYDHCGSIVCITVYKKGALEVVTRLSSAGPEGITKANIKLLEITRLEKKLKALNQKLTNLIKQFKSESMINEAVLNHYNE
ncbi:MAG: hypothetical protein N2511_05860 [Thermodesulfovibrionales bacterium]|nr:hypothetical protein [Thermodesulfovibrionales bacterium]